MKMVLGNKVLVLQTRIDNFKHDVVADRKGEDLFMTNVYSTDMLIESGWCAVNAKKIVDSVSAYDIDEFFPLVKNFSINELGGLEIMDSTGLITFEGVIAQIKQAAVVRYINRELVNFIKELKDGTSSDNNTGIKEGS